MRHDGTDDERDPALDPEQQPGAPAGSAGAPGVPAAPPADAGGPELDAWSLERHRELEMFQQLDLHRERELQAQREREVRARQERQRAALPPELRDAEDDLDRGPRRTTFARLRWVTALVALISIVALVASAFVR